MSTTRKTNFRTFLLWFPMVSASIFIGILLSSPLGEFLHDLRGVGPSASDDGFVEASLSLLFLVGLFMGIAQWLVLNTRLQKAHYWIPATIIGFAISGFIFYLLAVLLDTVLSIFGVGYYPVGPWILIFVIMLAGMVTGAFQWLFLKRNLAGSLKWSLATGLSFSVGSVLGLLFSSEQSVSSIFFSLGFGFVSGMLADPLIIRPEIEHSNRLRAS